jgi:hypothetical protein
MLMKRYDAAVLLVCGLARMRGAVCSTTATSRNTARDGRLRGEDLPQVFLKQIASLTITRTRCSTFGHGPGLRRQERRATVGLGQA